MSVEDQGALHPDTRPRGRVALVAGEDRRRVQAGAETGWIHHSDVGRFAAWWAKRGFPQHDPRVHAGKLQHEFDDTPQAVIPEEGLACEAWR